MITSIFQMIMAFGFEEYSDNHYDLLVNSLCVCYIVELIFHRWHIKNHQSQQRAIRSLRQVILQSAAIVEFLFSLFEEKQNTCEYPQKKKLNRI